MKTIPSSEITPEHLYLSRREFIRSAGFMAAGASLLAACGAPQTPPPATEEIGDTPPSSIATEDELGDPLTGYPDVTNYNNYYEFSTSKTDVAQLSTGFTHSPWEIAVGGLVNKPGTFNLDDLKDRFGTEERVYRLRCVEGWSMVIPWIGFPLRKLIEAVEPRAEAKYVRFQALFDTDRFPGQKSRWYTWPYVEGLRMDEAMNELPLLATGLYGKDLPAQNGAPVRLVVPWKYGFKSIKAIVKIELVDVMPVSLWMNAAPNEYGFFANVNPEVPHPRWSQSSERRIGEFQRRPTLMFNGYAEQVAHLYARMNLSRHY